MIFFFAPAITFYYMKSLLLSNSVDEIHILSFCYKESISKCCLYNYVIYLFLNTYAINSYIFTFVKSFNY